MLPSPKSEIHMKKRVSLCSFSEAFYESRMREQREELEQLMEERRKLLGIQDQLQKLHDQLGVSTKQKYVHTFLQCKFIH